MLVVYVAVNSFSPIDESLPALQTAQTLRNWSHRIGALLLFSSTLMCVQWDRKSWKKLLVLHGCQSFQPLWVARHIVLWLYYKSWKTSLCFLVVQAFNRYELHGVLLENFCLCCHFHFSHGRHNTWWKKHYAAMKKIETEAVLHIFWVNIWNRKNTCELWSTLGQGLIYTVDWTVVLWLTLHRLGVIVCAHAAYCKISCRLSFFFFGLYCPVQM